MDMEDDAELEQIRAKRMAQLQGGGGAPGGMGGGKDPQKDQEQKRAMDEARQSMLSQVLTPEARERLSRVALVKPEKARAVEDMIIRTAQMGQLREKLDEPKLIQLLEQLADKKKETKITIQRRRHDDDDE